MDFIPLYHTNSLRSFIPESPLIQSQTMLGRLQSQFPSILDHGTLDNPTTVASPFGAMQTSLFGALKVTKLGYALEIAVDAVGVWTDSKWENNPLSCGQAVNKIIHQVTNLIVPKQIVFKTHSKSSDLLSNHYYGYF
ncbi:uncharacterized protein LOC129744130 [Uranotaenia lowii]|uniref:uncharacterized protein LOC129744130 n=1 Tax=Uranotaenia lowii TaxID=190385 RepID=UPI002478C40F|nr:uncharacterized protein LOC129744130 [Uranotaenia lowii]